MLDLRCRAVSAAFAAIVWWTLGGGAAAAADECKNRSQLDTPYCDDSATAQNDTRDLMEGRGRGVSFPVSCGQDIQPRFDAALAALHSFWYGQALKEFRAIAEAKPDCAMAHWGVAMSVWNQIWAPPRPGNLKTGSDAITHALAVGAQTQRERDYLDALAAFYADHDKL